MRELTFQRTGLWNELAKRTGEESDETRRVLQSTLPSIEDILKVGGTAPLDFTLHDDKHAFRVSEKMIEVMPAGVLQQLSEQEIGLLLLAAYLHDIGMTPKRDKVRQVFTFLESGAEPSLSSEEKQEIQKWLDDTSSGVPGNISPSTEVRGNNDPLELVTAHYCRHRHNDWGEEWIRRNLNTVSWRDYASWLDDLVQLCRSHHEGYTELRKPRFDPKLVGNGPKLRVVHQRYLACVLRIADVLEFDPERTPDIVFSHRSIARSSAIYWHKDHHVQIHINSEHKNILLNAQPPSAQVHRAIIETADQIDAELALCRRIDHDTHFSVMGPLPLPHKWDLPSLVDRVIEPKADSYVFIDGAFRPNTQKLLQLLSGRQLYASPLDAVRELLQNSFDAVRELAAREILASGSIPQSKSVISNNHRVELKIDKLDGYLYLTCTDDGVGMSKHILENYLLVSGSSKRHDILELERRCEQAGLRLGRTGQFGIGVLSYFMIADNVRISTRRNNMCDDAEQNGWIFETEGVGTFGELRRGTSPLVGTEVRLRLRNEVTSNGEEALFEALKTYIQQSVVKVPCQFRLRDDALGKDKRVGPGWIRDEEALRRLTFARLRPDRDMRGPLETLPSAKRLEIERERAHWEKVKQEAASALRWERFEGELPENAGSYRFHIPVFDLPGGKCLAFLRASILEKGQLSVARVGSGLVYAPRYIQSFSWRGMLAGSHFSDVARAWGGEVGFAEVDWESADAGSISINRRNLNMSDKAINWLEWLKAITSNKRTTFAATNADSVYASINHRLVGASPTPGMTQFWRDEWGDIQSSHRVKWVPVKFPATTSMPFAYTTIPPGLECQGVRVGVLPSLSETDGADHYKGLSWNVPYLPPDRILIHQSYKTVIVPVWDSAPRPKSYAPALFHVCKFPDNWVAVCGLQTKHYATQTDMFTVWNTDNLLVQLFREDDWRWALKILEESPDPFTIRKQIVSSQGRAAAWIALTIQAPNGDLWQGLIERDKDFLKLVWKKAFGKSSSTLEIKFRSGDPEGVRVVSPTKWCFIAEQEFVGPHLKVRTLAGDILPIPEPAWMLTSEHQRNTQVTLSRLASRRSARRKT